jgi:hypothetical protein
MLTSIIVAFVVSVALSALWLRAVTRVTGARTIPISDLLLITGLCSGLAMLPGPGWLLAVLLLGLLVTRVEHLDLWPDALLMIACCAAVWSVAAISVWLV